MCLPKWQESSSLVIRVLANSILELLNTLRHPHDLLLKSCLLSLQVSKLLVQPHTLSTHRAVVAIDVLLDTMEFISECLPSVLALHSKHVLERLLLTAKDLDFLLVSGQVLVKLAARLSQVR